MLLTWAYLFIGMLLIVTGTRATSRAKKTVSLLVGFLSLSFVCYRFAKSQHDILVPPVISNFSWAVMKARVIDMGFGAWVGLFLVIILTAICCVQFKKYIDRG